MDTRPKNRVTVTIMGDEYTIRGSSSPESLEEAARHVDRLMRSLAEKNRQLSGYKIAVLAALNLADELLKAKHDYPRFDIEDKEREGEDELV
ncbi:MAG TPA: cell division protein ZapA [Bacillota bacterium]|nr:cell division protein ZapA [Bacillota bacterium]HOJ84679.1 cell division protein ZapA [Bacillota bacterium]HOL15244.1 cell division protein ZapA [Bacillota bacterium]HPZ11869.1 cell division protein ZapA [Bacillota bacterium]HQE10140.1 cell division protein ZapA [Bacillota bacterium]